MSQGLGMPDVDKLTPEQLKQLGLSRQALKDIFEKKEAREKYAPDEGSLAPDFNLKKLDTDGKLTDERLSLSSLKGKPVALVFGSYT